MINPPLMLGMGLALFTLRSLRPNLIWPERSLNSIFAAGAVAFVYAVVVLAQFAACQELP